MHVSNAVELLRRFYTERSEADDKLWSLTIVYDLTDYINFPPSVHICLPDARQLHGHQRIGPVQV